jgi:transcriptional regulator with XRE-family HTH domain
MHYTLEQIERIMHLLNYTQAQLATHLNVSRQTVSAWFTGKVPVRTYYLIAMTKVLDDYMSENDMHYDTYKDLVIWTHGGIEYARF